MADNPQQTLRELKELIVTYAKQETVDPLKGLGRFIGYGLAGAMLLGTGIVFLAIGVLRLLQDQTGAGCHFGSESCSNTLLDGDWSFVPYVLVFLLLLIGAGLAMMARGKKHKKQAS